MLDDTLGSSLVATLGDGEWAPTSDLHVQFLAPARSGPLIGHGRVSRKGRGVAFLAGKLSDTEGRTVATGTATAMIRQAHLSTSGQQSYETVSSLADAPRGASVLSKAAGVVTQ